MNYALISSKYYFSICDYTRCYAEPSLIYRSSLQEETDSYGWLILNGELEIINSTNPDLIGFQSKAENQFIKNEGQILASNTWRANKQTEWVCLSKSKNTPAANLNFESINLNGQITLLPGKGFFVITGSVNTSDLLTVQKNNYYRPRTSDITLTGTAIILTVRQI